MKEHREPQTMDELRAMTGTSRHPHLDNLEGEEGKVPARSSPRDPLGFSLVRLLLVVLVCLVLYGNQQGKDARRPQEGLALIKADLASIQAGARPFNFPNADLVPAWNPEANPSARPRLVGSEVFLPRVDRSGGKGGGPGGYMEFVAAKLTFELADGTRVEKSILYTLNKTFNQWSFVVGYYR